MLHCPSGLLVGINYCSSDLQTPSPTFPTPEKPNSRDYHMLSLDQQWKGMGGVLLLSLANTCSNLHSYVILLYVIMNTNLERIPKQTR